MSLMSPDDSSDNYAAPEDGSSSENSFYLHKEELYVEFFYIGFFQS